MLPHKLWYSQYLADIGHIDLASKYLKFISHIVKHNKGSSHFSMQFLNQLSALNDRLSVTFDLKIAETISNSSGWFSSLTTVGLSENIDNFMNMAVGIDSSKPLENITTNNSLYPVPKSEPADLDLRLMPVLPSIPSTFSNTNSQYQGGKYGNEISQKIPVTIASNSSTKKATSYSAGGFGLSDEDTSCISANATFPSYKYQNSTAGPDLHYSQQAASVIQPSTSYISAPNVLSPPVIMSSKPLPPVSPAYQPARDSAPTHSNSVVSPNPAENLETNVFASEKIHAKIQQSLPALNETEADDYGLGNSKLKLSKEDDMKQPVDETKPEAKVVVKKKSYFSMIFGEWGGDNKAPKAHLPTGMGNMKMINGKWVNTAASAASSENKLAPPPKMSSANPSMVPSASSSQSLNNSLGSAPIQKTTRSKYVDIMNPGSANQLQQTVAVSSLLPSFQNPATSNVKMVNYI